MIDDQKNRVTDAKKVSRQSFNSKRNFPIWLSTIAFLVILGWSAQQVNFSISDLIQGLPNIWDFISRSFPPDFTHLGKYSLSVLQTVQMALVGTVLAVIIAIPLGIGAAKNISPHPVIYSICRTVLNTLRSISEMIVALIFVTAVGLGPFPGVLALAIHSAGMLGKFYAEAIENTDKGQIEALEASGANRWQVIRYAIWPQILPEFISVNLFRWEINVRSATVLGLVGAGGIGFELTSTLRLFRYQESLTIVILILVTVMILDKLCTKIRQHIL
ncbi:phosphonate ABC transporter, permease protein PhnE [Paenibacillus kribbensis]|uniref:Phosphonate ABC transporter, permease protein PhnE n=2 Tax=Paenibacillus kribbensis TaxID=172713 RepID=A0A222WNZ7_9BACL|nr:MULTISPECIES: phosphonate ABC transporter, permease protein PhnE [Paenibacillus]ASR47461.1 phosphonate ABC transporter, permease protein PhnE [Paenibacillus kribbensis]MEC0236195.1 phosphonate ABC transporter, permease protein PhnE [Paenibacillus kribbensis]